MFSFRYITPLLFASIAICYGQKSVQKHILNPLTESILIDSKNCYFVELQTENTKEVLVEAEFEGEYQSDLAVTIQESGSNIVIAADFSPNFLHPNDKLSAHKVISISMKIVIPEDMVVRLYGTSSNVKALGKFQNLEIALADGDCVLDAISEYVTIKTQTGTITVNAGSGEINAESTYGEMRLQDIPVGDTIYELKSVQGDIHVNQTE